MNYNNFIQGLKILDKYYSLDRKKKNLLRNESDGAFIIAPTNKVITEWDFVCLIKLGWFQEYYFTPKPVSEINYYSDYDVNLGWVCIL